VIRQRNSLSSLILRPIQETQLEGKGRTFLWQVSKEQAIHSVRLMENVTSRSLLK
jgi:hypothetical protein